MLSNSLLTRRFALIGVGELLGDFISTEVVENLSEASQFARYQGGSPANLAANMARLGLPTAIVSAVGDDNLGKFLVAEVAKTGVSVAHVQQVPEPSSIVLVARSRSTPDFIPYRTADCQLKPEHLPDSLLAESAVFHTTCWPLSKQPAQQTVLEAARRAKAAGCLLSADLNYAERVWPNRAEAHAVIKEYLSHGALIKLSEDDAERFYGHAIPIEKVLEDFHNWGASLICFTLGAEGSLVSVNGDEPIRVPGRRVEVKDTTGAGDSYWAGFLTAYLSGHSAAQCAEIGANLAALKIATLGPLPPQVDKALIGM